MKNNNLKELGDDKPGEVKCTCGHNKITHAFSEDLCGAYLPEVGFECNCTKYKRDNLKYLEMLYEKKGFYEK